jgi:lysophospholipase L1-like esterase
MKSFPMPQILKILGTVVIVAGLSSRCLAHSANEAVERRENEPWMKRHLDFVEIAGKEASCQILFLGDSITDHWRTKGIETWNANYAPLNAVNFGISGDRTQHLLWRLKNGEIGVLRPKVVVMMIGTNNIGLNSDKKTPRNTLPEIVEGVEANVRYLREQLPDAKILLLAIFPRGEKDSKARTDVEEVNRGLAKLDDGNHVFFLDIGSKFLEPDGTLPKTLMPDLLHPNTKGYVIWAAAIKEPLAKLLE